jgi:hypothetical protein
VLDDGGTRTRSGGLCIALCGPDHSVIGGSVGGVLTAAGTVQVIPFFCGVAHPILCEAIFVIVLLWYGLFLIFLRCSFFSHSGTQLSG